MGSREMSKVAVVVTQVKNHEGLNLHSARVI